MASRICGNIGEFDSSKENWKCYTERLQQYFMANDVVDAQKQRAILLSACGAPTYLLIRNLAAPQQPTDKSFAQIVTLVQDHLQPSPSEIMERFHFHSRVRKDNESVAVFLAELRRLSEHCNFGDTLDKMLRDRLVCGINNQKYQRQMLAETDLTLKKATDLAQAMEAADRNSKDLASSVGRINVVRRQQFSGRQSTTCYRCGGKHVATDCQFKEAECYCCGKKGHLAKVCRSKKKQNKLKPTPQTGTHHISDADISTDTEDTTYTLFKTSAGKANPMMVTLKLNQVELPMELDTGASATIISEATYKSLWKKSTRPLLKPSKVKLRTYTGEELEILGALQVTVEYEEQKKNLTLLVAAGSGPSLLGRDWLLEIQLNWQQLHHFCSDKHLQEILNRHSEIFNEELGLVKQTAKLQIESNAVPRFCKPRTVPYALRTKVEKELERLEKEGIIEPIKFSKWAAPIVPVLKRDGSIRICGDYKVTINRAAKPDTYPLPRIEDLFTSLNGGKTFSKLDLAHAYLQVPLEEDSKDLVAINTHKGLYRYNRLPFGVSAAPSIFQRIMEGILRDLPGVCIYLDDILITGKTETAHLNTLDEVMRRLGEGGI